MHPPRSRTGTLLRWGGWPLSSSLLRAPSKPTPCQRDHPSIHLIIRGMKFFFPRFLVCCFKTAGSLVWSAGCAVDRQSICTAYVCLSASKMNYQSLRCISCEGQGRQLSFRLQKHKNPEIDVHTLIAAGKQSTTRSPRGPLFFSGPDLRSSQTTSTHAHLV